MYCAYIIETPSMTTSFVEDLTLNEYNILVKIATNNSVIINGVFLPIRIVIDYMYGYTDKGFYEDEYDYLDDVFKVLNELNIRTILGKDQKTKGVYTIPADSKLVTVIVDTEI